MPYTKPRELQALQGWNKQDETVVGVFLLPIILIILGLAGLAILGPSYPISQDTEKEITGSDLGQYIMRTGKNVFIMNLAQQPVYGLNCRRPDDVLFGDSVLVYHDSDGGCHMLKLPTTVVAWNQ